jgi:hypothetical protein
MPIPDTAVQAGVARSIMTRAVSPRPPTRRAAAATMALCVALLGLTATAPGNVNVNERAPAAPAASVYGLSLTQALIDRGYFNATLTNSTAIPPVLIQSLTVTDAGASFARALSTLLQRCSPARACCTRFSCLHLRE